MIFEAADPSRWWEFQPGQRVMVVEGYPGTVQAVMDGPSAGNEQYVVSLDSGLGGGEYSSSELRPLDGSGEAAKTASDDYPELGSILSDRLPLPISVAAQLTPARLAAAVDATRRATYQAPDRLVVHPASLACVGCAGTGQREAEDCDRCGATGLEMAAAVEAGWFTDLFRQPASEVSYDWCAFRQANRCRYPQGLDGSTARAAGVSTSSVPDHGRCPRVSWGSQEECPIGQPGPNTHAASRPEVPWYYTAAAPPMQRTYITKAEARGDSFPVSHEEFDRYADEGREMLSRMRAARGPIHGLDRNWDQLKAQSYAETRKPWGGATIDAHTGVPLKSDADKYAISVKHPDMQTVSVHESAGPEEFHRAMDQARDRFRPVLEYGSHHLGVFHDDENHRVDFDPVVVVDSPHEVHAIGAETHAIGGAYHFRSGDGFCPPHISEAE